MTSPEAAPRKNCYRCMRPVELCMCSSLPSVPTRTRVVVIQHPQERSHPFGTARMLGLSLPNSTVQTVYGGLERSLHHAVELPDDAVLLYPHPDAVDLATMPADQHPSTLVVLDGTWSHSRRLYRDNPWLQNLRHVRLAPAEPSRYRIRKEPSPECLSTVEATVLALRILEPETANLDSVITAFEQMIDRQIARLDRSGTHGRRRRTRQRTSRKLPAQITAEDLVVVYAESSLPGGDADATRTVVQLVAARVATGESFEALIRTCSPPPSEQHLAHMGIASDEVAAGMTPEEAAEQFRQFAGDGPIASWTQTALDWSQPLLVAGSPQLVLKNCYCNVTNHASGYLEQVVAREGMATVHIPCSGRAADRLGNAVAVARWLREQAPTLTSNSR